MDISALLSGLFSRPGSNAESPPIAPEREESSVSVLYECRNCGTNASADDDRCPVCESTDIASYAIEEPSSGSIG